MARLMADCRRWPSEINCSLVIIGEEDEVVRAAAEHASSVHGHEDTPELRQQLKQFLEPAEAYTAGPRAKEPPGCMPRTAPSSGWSAPVRCFPVWKTSSWSAGPTRHWERRTS